MDGKDIKKIIKDYLSKIGEFYQNKIYNNLKYLLDNGDDENLQKIIAEIKKSKRDELNNIFSLILEIIAFVSFKKSKNIEQILWKPLSKKESNPDFCWKKGDLWGFTEVFVINRQKFEIKDNSRVTSYWVNDDSKIKNKILSKFDNFQFPATDNYKQYLKGFLIFIEDPLIDEIDIKNAIEGQECSIFKDDKWFDGRHGNGIIHDKKERKGCFREVDFITFAFLNQNKKPIAFLHNKNKGSLSENFFKEMFEYL